MTGIDMDNDGIVTEKEIELQSKISELEMKQEKAIQQAKMAWISLIGVLGVTGILMLTDLVSIEKINALSDPLGWFYITLAGVIATFMGSQAWISKK